MSDQTTEKRYYGKYKATVVNNIDPELRGRLICEVPDVLSIVPSSWCECCAPLSGPPGPQAGVYMIPPIGAGVWVEFQRGDPDMPIWTGCRYSIGGVPPIAFLGLPVSPSIVLQTVGQNAIVISDLPGPTGGIMLKSALGATLIVNDTGIYIQNGKGAMINMLGPTVSVNTGALTVT
jgi:hypothetical protein